jgi:hypothetical protein
VGKWTRWNTDGKVAEIGDFGADGHRVHVKTLDDVSDNSGVEAPSLGAAPPSESSSSSPRFKR